MANMIPTSGPADSGSERAEPDIYWRLKHQLSDEFTVIHSLPWLGSAASEIDGRPVPTGEIDFIVLHPSLGVLAVEVKGGSLRYDRNEFVYVRSQVRIDPVRQVRRGTHSLAKWIAARGGPKLRIGYAILLPDSNTQGKPLPIQLLDATVDPPQPIVIDKHNLRDLGNCIQSVMGYWTRSLEAQPLPASTIDSIIDLICPIVDYAPSWTERAADDARLWLRLTEEQSACMRCFAVRSRLVVSGLPGTGKTILGVAIARQVCAEGKRVLLLTFNQLLNQQLKLEMADVAGATVTTFHSLCNDAARKLRLEPPNDRNSTPEELRQWFESGAPEALRNALSIGKMPAYDLLIVDEAQALRPAWWQILNEMMAARQIIAFCDQTQLFGYEVGATQSEVATIIGADDPYVLSVNLRSPRSVFDRIVEVQAANYQRFSPRPFLPDTLEEIVTEEPKNALEELLNRLEAEGVSFEDTCLLCLDAAWKEDLKAAYGNRIRIEYIGKFRGIECPIAIVWAYGRFDEAALVCAYSRATTKCISIFDLAMLYKGYLGKFGECVTDSVGKESIEARYRQGLTQTLVETEHLETELVTPLTCRVQWCSNWQAWLVPFKSEIDTASELWLDHICVVSSSPVYSWTPSMRGEIILRCHADTIEGRRVDRTLQLLMCVSCRRLTPHDVSKVRYGGSAECQLCAVHTNALNSSIEQEIAAMKYLDNIVGVPGEHERSVKQTLPISLFALALYRTLDVFDALAFRPTHSMSRILYVSAVVIAGFEIHRQPFGSEISLRGFATKSYGWCSDLKGNGVSPSRWQHTLGTGFAFWLKSGLIEKLRSGLYKSKRQQF